MRLALPVSFALSLTSTSAFAWGLDGSLAVANDAGQVTITIDGRTVAQLRDDTVGNFPLFPGYHYVSATTSDGFTVFNDRVWIGMNSRAQINLQPPRAQLALRNDGMAPLLVTVNQRDGVWMAPGERRSFDVRAGDVDVLSQVWTGGGYRQVERRDFWLNPGNSVSAHLVYVDPFAHLEIRNPDSALYYVYVDGRHLATVEHGASRFLDIGSGRNHVTVQDQRGNLIFDSRLDLGAGEVFRLDGRAGGPRGPWTSPPVTHAPVTVTTPAPARPTAPLPRPAGPAPSTRPVSAAPPPPQAPAPRPPAAPAPAPRPPVAAAPSPAPAPRPPVAAAPAPATPRPPAATAPATPRPTAPAAIPEPAPPTRPVADAETPAPRPAAPNRQPIGVDDEEEPEVPTYRRIATR